MSTDEVIDFRYDRQGRLIETSSKHYREKEENWVYKHGRKVEGKHYRRTSNGGWKLLETKNFNDIDLFTPNMDMWESSFIVSIKCTTRTRGVVSKRQRSKQVPCYQDLNIFGKRFE